MAFGSVLCDLADWVRFGKHVVQFPIMFSIMFLNEGCHFPYSVNISVNCMVCM